jgi:hypothetical protein
MKKLIHDEIWGLNSTIGFNDIFSHSFMPEIKTPHILGDNENGTRNRTFKRTTRHY